MNKNTSLPENTDLENVKSGIYSVENTSSELVCTQYNERAQKATQELIERRAKEYGL